MCGFAIAVSSCGSKVQGLQHDPSFTYHKMELERTAIGGVAYPFPASQGGYMSREEATNLLTLQITRYREDLNVHPVGEPIHLLGEQAYTDMMYAYERGGLITPDDLEMMRNILYPDLRYLVFARIEQDLIHRGRREKVEGKDEDQRDVLELTTTRSVTVAFNVYDILESRSVWRGHLSKNAKNKNRYVYDRNNPDEEQDLLEIIVGVIFEGSMRQPTHPEAPNMTTALTNIFRRFAENLPKPGELSVTAKR